MTSYKTGNFRFSGVAFFLSFFLLLASFCGIPFKPVFAEESALGTSTLIDLGGNSSENATSPVTVPDLPQFLPTGEPLFISTMSSNVQPSGNSSVSNSKSGALTSLALNLNILTEPIWEPIFSLNFNSSVPGTIQDINGLGTGFTHRLPGTGWALPVNDPYSNLLANPGRLTMKSSRFAMDFGWPYQANWARTHPEIGDLLGTKLAGIGTQSFRIVALFRNAQIWQISDHLSVYAFANPEHGVRAIAHQDVTKRDYFFSIEHDGYQHLYVDSGGTFNNGDDIRITITRTGDMYNVVNEDLTTGNISYCNVETNFLDFATDLYVGVFYSIPWSYEVEKFSQLDSFEVFKGSTLKLLSVSAIPETLWVDQNGVGSEIKFHAETSEEMDVTFKVKNASQTWTLTTIRSDPANVAELPWTGLLPGGGVISPGSYTIIAQGPSNEKEAPFEVKKKIEVTQVAAYPPLLLIGNDGAGSGIVFRAVTTEAANVTFTISHAGQTWLLGNSATVLQNNENVARFSWWGKLPDGNSAADGLDYKVIAEIDSSDKESGFVVRNINYGLLGLGNWVKAKDPLANIPTEIAAKPCWSQIWCSLPDIVTSGVGNFAVGDPVSIVSGNFILPQVDLNLKSKYPLVLARIYNSLDPNSGLFGRGWSSPFLSHLEISSNKVIFVNSDGSRVLFDKQGVDFLAPLGCELILKYSTDTELWTVSHPNGSTWTFDNSGKIILIAEACCGRGLSDALQFEYNQNGLLSRVSNPAGQWLKFSCNPDGRIIQVIDSSSRIFSYSYDSNGNLLSFADPIGRITDYTYSDDGFLTRVHQPGNRITAISYLDRRVAAINFPDGCVSRFTTDFENRKIVLKDPVETTHEYGFDANWRLNSYSVAALGINKTLSSSNGFVTGITNTLGAREVFTNSSAGILESHTDALGNITSFEVDQKFHKLTRKMDSLGREWRYSYCVRGNMLQEVDPAGGITSYTYDAHNNRLSRTDPLGHVQRWVYDPLGNYLVQAINPEGGISSFSYDVRGNLISSSDPLGRTTAFSFDMLDRLVKTVYPDGRFVEVEYNDAGNVMTRRDNFGRETHYIYDFADRLTTLIRPDGTTFIYAYNAGGQKISETDSLGRVTRFEYSPIGLLMRTIYPDGSFETMSYDTENRLTSRTNELGQTTNLEYDLLGRLLATIDPTGARWESQYDNAGRKIADKDPLNRVTTYQLDNLDRITKVIRPDSSFTTNSFDAVGNLLSTVDALGNQWSFVYDNLNRQVQAIQPNGASSTTAFDAAGQVIAETDALNRTTRYSFDNGGRRTETTDALNNVWRNFYDSAGRLIAVQDPMGAVSSMTYDIMDRVISQSDPLGNINSFEVDNAGRRVVKVDAIGRRSITAFDQRDRVIAETDPEGHTVSFGYNSAGQRVSLTDGANRTWRWNFDNLGRVTSEIDPLGNLNRYGFDSVGNRVSWTNARNQTTTYTFNLMNRLSQVNYPDATLATLSYDLEGRELSRSGPAGMVKKTWDSVGNLTSESFMAVGAGLALPAKTWRYSFDLVGNRISAIDPEGGNFVYRYSALNQLAFLDPPGRNDEVTLVYDSAGRQVSETKPNVFTENIFDPAGRLLSTTHAKTKGQKPVLASRQYSYNQVGNRTSMTDEDGKTTFYEFNRSDWLTKAVYPDATKYHGRYLAHLKDALGSTIALTNRGGHAVARVNYDAWGNLKFPDKQGHGNSPCREDELDGWLDRFDFGRSFGFEHDGWHWGRHHAAALTPYLFASRRLDSFSKLYNNRERFYQSKTGRFITKDPIGFAGGLNLFAYANCNPGRYLDPFGTAYSGILTKETTEGPSSGLFGSFRWGVKWRIMPKSLGGGWVIQNVKVMLANITVQGSPGDDGMNNDRFSFLNEPNYWEAWRVNPDGFLSFDNVGVVGIDTIGWKEVRRQPIVIPGALEICPERTKGSIIMSAVAEFYEDLALPDHFIAGAVDHAGPDLRATKQDPGNLPGGTGKIFRGILSRWEYSGETTNVTW